jgi:hypothetical protein
MPKNVFGSTLSTSFHGSTGHKIFGSDGSLYQGGAQVFSTNGELIQNSSDLIQAISASTALVFSSTAIKRSGITYIYPSSYTNLSSSDRAQLSLDNPFAGCKKDIYFDSGSTNVMLDISMTGASIFGTTDWSTKAATKVRYIHFSSALNGVQGISLQGLSTSLWAVQGVQCESTAITNWGNAAGIRTSTAARTS